MSCFTGPKILNESLVLCLDAANIKSALKSVEVLIVGGGGGGGFGHGGGGAGGAVLYKTDQAITPGSSYTITVGAGGAGNQTDAQNNQGGNSSAFGVTATGGGSGSNETGNDSSGRNGVGGNGANGGGGSYGFLAGGTGTSPVAAGWQVFAGNVGGSGGWNGNANYPTGGGAGAGSAGGNAQTGQTGGAAGGQGQAAGNGGIGVENSILGPTYYWGGGGGGTAYNTGGISGNGGIGGGGGGAGSAGSSNGVGGGQALNSGSPGVSNGAGGNAGANTGGGGGAGANESFAGGSGGSGIVVIRYPGPQKALGGTVTQVNGFTVHSFTSIGDSTFQPVIWGDVSNKGNSGTLTNGPTFSSENNGSILFDGTNDYVIGPGISSLFTGNLTAEVWIKINATPTDWVRIVGTGGSGGNRTFGLWYYTDKKLLWQRYGAGDPSLIPATVLDLGKWYHIVATTNGSLHTLYLNGESIGSATAAGPWAASGENITIGFAGFHAYTSSNIGSVKLYTSALSSQEVLQHFNAQRGRYGI